MKVFILFTMMFAIVGCGTKTLEVKTTTVKGKISTTDSEIGMVATGANTRMIMANLGNGRVCAEPPPETQVTINSTFRVLLESSKNITGDDPKSNEARIEAYKAYNQAVTQLYKRSHSNQIYRDASYYLCQAYMNGALEPEDMTLLLGAFAAGEADGSEVKRFFSQLAKDIAHQNVSIGGAYLATQVFLTKMAFKSLNDEIDDFYDFSTAKEQGKTEAQLEFQKMLDLTKGDLVNTIQSSAKKTQRKVDGVQTTTNENAMALGELKSAVGKIPVQ